MAKIIVLALGIVLALLLSRALRTFRLRGEEAPEHKSAKLVRCPKCESYHPEGEPCGCEEQGQ